MMPAARHIVGYAALLAMALLAPAAALAADGLPTPQEGVNYRLIAQQPRDPGGKIEVIDFFWFGCPHCNKLQPAFEAWHKRMPADVTLRRIPVILHDNWAPHARIYYTLQALGLEEQLHAEVYRGYHVEELHMSKPEVMADWAAQHGIDRERWLAAYNSPEVAQQVEQAKTLTAQYEVLGTPSIVVDGRYLTSSGMFSEEPEMVPAMESLIDMARANRSAKPTPPRH